LYNIVANGNSSCGGYATVAAASGDTILSTNNFTHANGALTGTWEVQGNVIIGSGAYGGDGTITMTGAGSKTYTYTAGGTGSHLRINNAGISVSANSGTTDIKVTLFSLLAGTFVAPSGSMTLGRYYSSAETILTVSGGTFNHNNGTVAFVPSGGCGNPIFTADVLSSLTLNNVTVNASSGCGGQGKIATASGDTITTNNFTQTDGYIDGTWEIQGNYTVGAGADGGAGTLSFTGPNDQTYTDNGGDEPNGNITINKPVGTVLNLASNADWNSAGQTTTITSGILNLGAYNLYTGGTLTVGANGVLHDFSTGDLILGGTVSNSGIIRLESSGSCGATDAISITSSVGATQRAWSGSGVYTLWDTSIQDQGGTAKVQVNSGTSVSGNGTNFVFNSACNFTNNNTSLTNGLVGYWPMEENTGTTTADMSGNGNTGTLTGTPSWGTGQIGNGINFDGVDDYISTADIDYGAGNSISVSVWFKFTTCGNDGYCYIVAKSLFLGDTPYTLYTVTAGNICFTVNTAISQVCSSGTYNNGVWHYAVATFDGSTGRIYVDGVNVGNLGFSPTSNNNVVTMSDSGRKFTGTLDEIRIYNRALTAAEVQQLYYNVRPAAASIPSGKFQLGSGKLKFP
jgi:hypothetical protein